MSFNTTKVLWGSRAVGGVMVMALADWLDLGVVGGVIGRGSGQLAGGLRVVGGLFAEWRRERPSSNWVKYDPGPDWLK